VTEPTPHVHAPAGLSSLLKRKVAGVPVLYIVALFVVILAFVAWKMKPAKDLTTPPASDSEDTGTDSGTVPTTILTGAPGLGVGNSGPVEATNPAIIDSNDAWIRRAVAWLVGQGVASGGTAQAALTKYVNGEDLSFDEGKLRDAAIKQFGLPPESITPGATLAAGPKRVGTPPVTHTVTGPQDDSTGDLAVLYYGLAHNAYAQAWISTANPSLPPNGVYPPGTKVKVPAYHQPVYAVATATMRTAAQFAAKNHTTTWAIQTLNHGVIFPVKPGARILVA
jgi:hypothetical protein